MSYAYNLNKTLLSKLTVLAFSAQGLIEEDESFYSELLDEFRVFSDSKQFEEYFFEHPKQNNCVLVLDTTFNPKEAIALCKLLQEKNKEIPVIVLSDEEHSHNIVEFIKMEVKGFHLHPIDPKKLIIDIQESYKTNHLGKALRNTLSNSSTYLDAIDSEFMTSKTNTRGRITNVNEKFCDVTGYSAEELIGNSHKMLKHPETSTKMWDNVWDALRAGKVWKGSYKNRNKFGEEIVIQAAIFPVYDSSGVEIKEYMSISTDVTAQQQESREFKNKVTKEFVSYKLKIVNLNKKITELEEIAKFSYKEKAEVLEKRVEKTSEAITKRNNHIKFLEKSIDDLNSNFVKEQRSLNDKLNQFKRDKEFLAKVDVKEQNELLENELKDLKKKFKHIHSEFEKIKAKDKELLEKYQSENEELKGMVNALQE